MPSTTATTNDPNIVSRGRRQRTGTIVSISDRYAWADRSMRRYARYTVTCEAHDTETTTSQWGEALDAARAADRWCEHCQPVAVNRSARRARTTEQPLGLARRFGVEFEFYGVRRYTVEEWLRSSGMRDNGWSVKSDCSVSGEGLEVVSPPLSGQDGLEQVRIVLAWLNEAGARVNRTCGTHVHHDAADLDLAAITRFVKTYVNNQNLIDWLVSPSRRAEGMAQYCRPWTERDVRYFEENSTEHSLYATTRYKTVNVASYGRHGTLEVRQHQGTLSYDKTVAWIKLGQAMMDAAKVRATAVPSQDGIQTLFSRINLDEDAAAFMLGRAIQFGAPLAQVATAQAAS
jgi:hypothetical protein